MFYPITIPLHILCNINSENKMKYDFDDAKYSNFG